MLEIPQGSILPAVLGTSLGDFLPDDVEIIQEIIPPTVILDIYNTAKPLQCPSCQIIPFSCP